MRASAIRTSGVKFGVATAMEDVQGRLEVIQLGKSSSCDLVGGKGHETENYSWLVQFRHCFVGPVDDAEYDRLEAKILCADKVQVGCIQGGGDVVMVWNQLSTPLVHALKLRLLGVEPALALRPAYPLSNGVFVGVALHAACCMLEVGEGNSWRHGPERVHVRCPCGYLPWKGAENRVCWVCCSKLIAPRYQDLIRDCKDKAWKQIVISIVHCLAIANL